MSIGRRLATTGLTILMVLGFWLMFRPDPAPADGKVHIRYWEKWTGFEEAAMRKVVERYNKSQDRVHVNYLAVSQVDQKMLLSTSGGNPPDVAGLWDYNVVVYADYNALRPLDDFCKRDGITADQYLPAYWNLCTHNNGIYALPTTPASVALHWNRKLFREAGLDPDRPPKTLEELDEMADKLIQRDRSGRIEVMGYLPAEPGWWNWGWGYFFGGSLWPGGDQVSAVSPENMRAFNWVKGYSDRYGSRDIQVFQSGFGNFSSPQNAFMAEQVAMVLQGVWMANYINNTNPSLDWDAAPFPHPADRPDLANSTPVGLDVLVIPAGAPHPEEAWDFIRFVQQQENMEFLCHEQWKHSPLSSVSEAFLANHRNKRIRLFQDLAASNNTFNTPRVGIWREWQDEMNSAFQKIWTSGEDPEDALEYVERRVQPKLARYLDNLERRRVAAAN
jgi:multiple sugar transport system substrate-binding protein